MPQRAEPRPGVFRMLRFLGKARLHPRAPSHLRRLFQSLHYPHRAHSIQLSAKRPDLFRTATMLLKLERTEGRWLSESVDVKSNELMDFLFDGMGCDCHHNLLRF